ncbi:50S ribosomal protein L2 [Candidatus Parcubacteria bacterium]|nr:50S ribosomal protein L2 [Candidatus Parcubacteria bacterium]
MALKKYKPTSPGRRGMMGYDFSTLDKVAPEKSLLAKMTRKVGRGSAGKITVRHRGGGAKRRFRIIDFKMNKFDIPAKVQSIEYDPNRTSFIALVAYADGEKRYILALDGLKKDDNIVVSESASIQTGNRMMLKNIPSGTIINNVEMFSGKGGQIARSAGSFAKLMAVESGYAHVKLSSGQVRLLPENCFATIGQISNTSYSKVVIGKAGRSRWMGRRPHVRGSAMNPVDHPHGGGEGCQPIGLKHPKTPWGKPALGFKTRKKNKRLNNFKKRIAKFEEEVTN